AERLAVRRAGRARGRADRAAGDRPGPARRGERGRQRRGVAGLPGRPPAGPAGGVRVVARRKHPRPRRGAAPPRCRGPPAGPPPPPPPGVVGMSDRPPSTRHGLGRILVFVYGLFALSATGRAVVQLTTKASDAPVAYSLSLFSGIVYIVATWALATDRRRLA